MDIIDDANEAAETHLKASLSHRQPEGPRPVGFCYNCAAFLDDPTARWCDADCRDDWEKVVKAAADARLRD